MHVVLDTQHTQSGNGHFSGVLSIMIVKLAQAGEGQPYFTLCTITNQVAVHAAAERAKKLTLFYLYPYGLMYSVVLAALSARALVAPAFLGKLTHD